MSDRTRPCAPRRGRLLAAGLASVTSLSTLAAVAGTAPAAAAPGECDTAYPMAELRSELAGPDPVELSGLTVVKGTTPVPFTARVLGIVEDGIAADVDLVMVDVELPDAGLGPANQPTGIWSGMSGSPLYADDGRLLGAISYGMSWGPSRIAGVTPYEDMVGHLAGRRVAEASTVPVPPELVGRQTARASRAAGAGSPEVTRLEPTLSVTGVSARRLSTPRLRERPWSSTVRARAGGRSAAATAASVVAGGNLGAAVSHGDVTAGSVGTATTVCDGRVLGFGHPASFLGSTTMALLPADAVYIQADPAGAPFKVANFGAPVGTVTEDRLTGIAGTLGAAPAAVPVTSTVVHGERRRTGRTDVYLPGASAETAYYQYWANHDRVLDGDQVGSAELGWRVTGADENGRPFSLALTNRHTGGGLDDAVFSLSDLLWSLDSLGATVGSVTSTSTVSDQRVPLRVTRLEQRRGTSWVRVTRRAPAVAKRGRTVALRVVLTGGGATVHLPVSFRAPSPSRARKLRVSVAAGGDGWLELDTTSVATIRRSLAQVVRNDVVTVSVGAAAGRPEEEFDPSDYLRGRTPQARKAGSGAKPRTRKVRPPFERTFTSRPQARVVSGWLSVPVRVRR